MNKSRESLSAEDMNDFISNMPENHATFGKVQTDSICICTMQVTVSLTATVKCSSQ